MIAFQTVSTGTGDLLGCRLCGAGSAGEHTPAQDVLAAIADVRSRGAENVMLAGSEPFRHPALPALVAACAEAGFARIAMLTDAGALTIPENASGALEAGLRHIHVPLFGPDAPSHDAACASGRFAQTTAGVEGFLAAATRAAASVALVGVLPLCEHTLASAPAIVATFARLGALAVRIVPAPGVDADAPEVRAAFETGMVNGVWVWVDAPETIDDRSGRAPLFIRQAGV